jgi:hypothetical protein
MQEPSSIINNAWTLSPDVGRYEDAVRSLIIVMDHYIHPEVAVCVSRREEQTEKCLDTILEHHRFRQGVFVHYDRIDGATTYSLPSINTSGLASMLGCKCGRSTNGVSHWLGIAFLWL